MAHALGIDIGGTGIKGALVDTVTGELVTDRYKLPTPKGGSPRAIVDKLAAETAKAESQRADRWPSGPKQG